MKDVKELLHLVIKELHKSIQVSGICKVLLTLRKKELINEKEYCILYNLIEENRPSEIKHSEFYMENWKNTAYYFPPMSSIHSIYIPNAMTSREVRIKFVTKLLSIYEEN